MLISQYSMQYCCRRYMGLFLVALAADTEQQVAQSRLHECTIIPFHESPMRLPDDVGLGACFIRGQADVGHRMLIGACGACPACAQGTW